MKTEHYRRKYAKPTSDMTGDAWQGLSPVIIESLADDAKTARQKAYVKETLTRALKEVEAAKHGEVKMMTEEEFLEGLKTEGILWK